MKTKETIIKITEAFSMQPRSIFVGSKLDHYNDNSPIVDKIVAEIRGTPNTDLVEVYVGYDSEGNKLFSYLTNAVNVEYLNK
jgi:hypothetical protein